MGSLPPLASGGQEGREGGRDTALVCFRETLVGCQGIALKTREASEGPLSQGCFSSSGGQELSF